MVTLRQATVGDLDVIHDIRRDAILGVKFEPLSERDLREWADRRTVGFFRERVAANQVVVAFYEGRAVGWGSFSWNRVTALYVRPSVSSRGIGREVISWLEFRIKDDGYAFAKLESSPNAVNFYKGIGYLGAGPPENGGAVPMKKDL